MMAVGDFRTYELSWNGASTAEDLLFKKILKITAGVVILLLFILAILPVQKAKFDEPPDIPERLVKLVLQAKPVPPKPKPAPVVKKAPVKPKSKPVPKPVAKPKPKPTPVPAAKKPASKPKAPPAPSARDVAKKSGLLAFKDDLADLRSNTISSSIARTSMKQGDAKSASKSTTRSIITSKSTSGSGGINTARYSRNTGGGGLAGRSTTQVSSPIGNGGGGDSSGGAGRGSGGGASRTIEDIQIIFDQNKGRIYAVYNRALRRNPTLQGKVVLKLTIQPSGKVSQCTIVSSELKNSELEQKLVKRIKLIDFGAKPVGAMTITYPIDFLPS